jgi:hypothetical protein
VFVIIWLNRKSTNTREGKGEEKASKRRARGQVFSVNRWISYYDESCKSIISDFAQMPKNVARSLADG